MIERMRQRRIRVVNAMSGRFGRTAQRSA
jgi:hypothetical protein